MIFMAEKIGQIYYIYIFLSFPCSGETLYTGVCEFFEHSSFITFAICIVNDIQCRDNRYARKYSTSIRSVLTRGRCTRRIYIKNG